MTRPSRPCVRSAFASIDQLRARNVPAFWILSTAEERDAETVSAIDLLKSLVLQAMQFSKQAPNESEVTSSLHAVQNAANRERVGSIVGRDPEGNRSLVLYHNRPAGLREVGTVRQGGFFMAARLSRDVHGTFQRHAARRGKGSASRFSSWIRTNRVRAGWHTFGHADTSPRTSGSRENAQEDGNAAEQSEQSARFESPSDEASLKQPVQKNCRNGRNGRNGWS